MAQLQSSRHARREIRETERKRIHTHFTIRGQVFALEERRIAVAGTEVRLLGVPDTALHLDRIAALRGVAERTWPYWLQEWPATYALAESLTAEDLPGNRQDGPAETGGGTVLDLGCGSEFLAAFLRIRFGAPALSCDFNADACRLAAMNIALNAPGDPPDSSEATLHRFGGAAPRVVCADFNDFPARLRFGAVFAGEMLYSRDNHLPILGFLGRHLEGGGSAFLADPGRSAAEGFGATASAHGFSVEIRRVESRAAGRAVQVYRLRRAGTP